MKQLRLLFIVVWFLPISLFSQGYSVQMSVDTNRIGLGERTHITLHFTESKSSKYTLPAYGQELIKNIQLCSMPEYDSVEIQKDLIQIICKYCITSFVPGEYSFQIGPIIHNNKDTIWLPTIGLSVVADTVDLQGEIRDVAPIQTPQYTWFERNKQWIVWGVVVLGVILLIVVLWIMIRARLNKPKQIVVAKEPQELPHVRAIRLLTELQHKDLCKQHLYKEYYTEITDIVREYFEERLHIPLFERTSDEIIRDISRTGLISIAVIQNLQLLLQQADMVKFATYIPPIDQTEIHMGIALFCIQESIEHNKYNEQ